MTVRLLGVPFNSAGTTDGVAGGPSALRRAGALDALRAAGVAVDDQGDVALEPSSPERDPVSGIISPGALGSMIDRVREVVAAAHEGGVFPIVLGGDCPVLIGCLAATSDVGLLFIDGHEDAWPPHVSTTGEAADMELGFLLGRTTTGLPQELRRLIPSVDPGRVVVIGARDQAELREAGVASIDDVVDVVRTDAVTDSDIASAVDARARRLDGIGPWWLHVDLDVLSTSSLAAVDYRQPGGLDWSVLTGLTRRALSSPNVIGWTVTIFNPDLDPDGTGAAAIVRYLAQSASAIRRH